jgi:hypothetical protein
MKLPGTLLISTLLVILCEIRPVRANCEHAHFHGPPAAAAVVSAESSPVAAGGAKTTLADGGGGGGGDGDGDDGGGATTHDAEAGSGLLLLPLDVITPASRSLKVHLPSRFPPSSSPSAAAAAGRADGNGYEAAAGGGSHRDPPGLATWFLLDGLVPGQRYEARACYTAIVSCSTGRRCSFVLLLLVVELYLPLSSVRLLVDPLVLSITSPIPSRPPHTIILTQPTRAGASVEQPTDLKLDAFELDAVRADARLLASLAESLSRTTGRREDEFHDDDPPRALAAVKSALGSSPATARRRHVSTAAAAPDDDATIPTSALLLRVVAAADYVTDHTHLLDNVPPTYAEIILDPWVLGLVPATAVPIAAYIMAVAAVAVPLARAIADALALLARDDDSTTQARAKKVK